MRAGTYPGVGQRWRARGNSALYTGIGLVPADSKRYPRALAIPRDGRRVAPACVQCARVAPFTRASARGVERPGIARLSKASVSGLRTVRAGSSNLYSGPGQRWVTRGNSALYTGTGRAGFDCLPVESARG